MKEAQSEREHIEGLLEVMYDFAKDGDGIVDFLSHIGFDITAIRRPTDLIQALPAFYRIRAGRYDVARLSHDIETWGPIAEGIEYVRQRFETDGTGGL